MSGELRQPFVGPRTFEERHKELFFGREKEARQLLSLVVAERLVLFYAQSGAGKSSLINARLRPNLLRENFVVLPTARVGGDLPEDIDQVDNIFAFNLIASLESEIDQAEDYTHSRLTEYLQGYFERNRAVDEFGDEKAQVLIIDQFEEIVTTNLRRWDERREFFVQLADTMKAIPLMWVVLSMREDHVAAIEPYARLMPGGMLKRYYMQRMKGGAALKAIEEPARKGGRPFTPQASRQLVDDLRQLRAGAEAAETEGQRTLGEFIEPVQLQVVCYQLWENLNALDEPPDQIDVADLTKFGDVDQALAQFYESAISKVLQKTSASELALRTWFEESLITKDETRGTVYQGQEATAGMANEVVLLLADHYLLRAEERYGGTWYELVHDRFVAPILKANQAWRERQNPLFHAALDWEESGRLESYLQTGARLRAIKADIGASEVEPLVAAYLAECEKADGVLREKEAHRRRELELERQRANEQAQRVRITGILLGVSLIFLLAAIGFALQSRASSREAIRAADLAATREVEANLAAAEAERLQGIAEVARGQAEDAEKQTSLALEQVTAAERETRALLYETQGSKVYDDDPLLGVRLLLEGAAIEGDEQTRFDRLALAREMILRGRVANLGNDVEEMRTLAANSALLVLQHEDGLSDIWHPNQTSPLMLLLDPIQAVQFSPDGSIFVVDFPNAPGEIRRSEDGALVATLSSPINGFGELFFGSTLTTTTFVVNYEDKPAEIWNGGTGKFIAVLKDKVGNTFFSPDSRLIIVDYLDPFVADQLLRAADGTELANYEDDEVIGVTGSPQQTLFVVNFLFEDELRDAEGERLAANVDEVTFSPDGTRLFVDYLDPEDTDALLDSTGEEVATLAGEIREAEFVADGRAAFVKYVGAAVLNELIRVDDGQPLASDISTVTFGLDRTHYVLDYSDPGRPNELRSLEDGTMSTFGGNIEFVDYLSGGQAILITYSEGEFLNQLRALADGRVLATDVVEVTFNQDGSRFLVAYSDPDRPDELRSLPDGAVVASFEGDISRRSFVSEGQAVMTWYRDSGITTIEIRRSADGQVLATGLDNVRFSPDGTHLVVYYRDPEIPNQLLNLDGEELEKGVSNVTFSPGGTLFVVEFEDPESPSVLRNMDGDVLAEGVTQVTFSPDDARFVVDFLNPGIADELRSGDNDTQMKFTAEIYNALFLPETDLFAVNYEEPSAPAELRQADTGELAAKLSDAVVARVGFSSDRALYVVYHEDGSAAVYRQGDSDPLASFPQKVVSNVRFDNDPPDAANPLTSTQLSDEVTDAAGDRWSFSGQGGDVVTIQMRGIGMDAYLDLVDESGNIVFSNDDSGGTRDALIAGFQLPFTGRYTIVARGFGGDTGSYTLSVSGITPSLSFGTADVQQSPAKVFVVEFGGEARGSAELRSVDDGRSLAAFPNVSSIQFSPDPGRSLLLVRYFSGLTEVLLAANGENVTALGAVISRITFSPDSETASFLVYFEDGSVELRRTADGELLSRLADERTESNPTLLNATGDSVMFGLRFPEAPTELFRTADGHGLGTLSGDAYKLTCAPEEEASVCIVAYTDVPGEVRDANSGRLLETLPNRIQGLTLMPNSGGEIVIVDYVGAHSELRHAIDGSKLATLTGSASSIIAQPGDNEEIFIISYVNARSEVRRSADGELITTLAGRDAAVYDNFNDQIFIVSFADASSQAVRAANGELATTLPDNVRSASFSAGEDENLVVISYAGAPAEVRRTDDGRVLAVLNGEVIETVFGPGSEATLFAINYSDSPAEVRRIGDGQLVAELSSIEFFDTFVTSLESSAGAALFVATYETEFGERTDVRQASDGALVATFAPEDEVGDVLFSREPGATVFVVEYLNAPPELRNISDNQLFPLTDEVAFMSVEPNANVFEVDYADDSRELRSLVDGELLAGDIAGVAFSPVGGLFVVEYAGPDLPDELRNYTGNILITGTFDVTFSPDGTHMLVDYRDPGVADELWSAADGDVVKAFGAEVLDVLFKAEAGVLIVNYEEPEKPAELRDLESGDLMVALSGGPVLSIRISPDQALFAVYYEDGSAEVYRAGESQSVASFAQQIVSAVRFNNESPGSPTALTSRQISDEVMDQEGDRWTFVGQAGATVTIRMQSRTMDTYLELLDEADNYLAQNDDSGETTDSLISLELPYTGRYTIVARGYNGATGSYTLLVDGITPTTTGEGVGFEIDAATAFVVEFGGDARGTAELWSLIEGQQPSPISDVANMTFSSDPGRSLLIVETFSGLRDIYLASTGERLAKDVTDFTFSPGEDYFVVSYADAPAGIFDAATGNRLATLSDVDAELEFSDDDISTYMIATYRNGQSEVWALADGSPRLLAELGGNVVDTFWDLFDRRLIVRYLDGQVSLIDLGLLATLRRAPSTADILRLTCEYLSSSGMFDEGAAMAAYLGESEQLEGCR